MNVPLAPRARRRLGIWTVVVALALATVVFWIRRAPAQAAPAPRTAAPAATEGARRVDPAALERVEAAVAARNRAEPNQAAAFENAGWKMVAAPPPDPRLVGLGNGLRTGQHVSPAGVAGLGQRLDRHRGDVVLVDQ